MELWCSSTWGMFCWTVPQFQEGTLLGLPCCQDPSSPAGGHPFLWVCRSRGLTALLQAALSDFVSFLCALRAPVAVPAVLSGGSALIGCLDTAGDGRALGCPSSASLCPQVLHPMGPKPSLLPATSLCCLLSFLQGGEESLQGCSSLSNCSLGTFLPLFVGARWDLAAPTRTSSVSDILQRFWCLLRALQCADAFPQLPAGCSVLLAGACLPLP